MRKVQEVLAGDICAVVGLESFNIGDTIADPENPEAVWVEKSKVIDLLTHHKDKQFFQNVLDKI